MMGDDEERIEGFDMPPVPTVVVFVLPPGFDVNNAPMGAIFDQVLSPNPGASPGSIGAHWHKTRFKVVPSMHRGMETKSYAQKLQRLLSEAEIAEYTARGNAGEGQWI